MRFWWCLVRVGLLVWLDWKMDWLMVKKCNGFENYCFWRFFFGIWWGMWRVRNNLFEYLYIEWMVCYEFYEVKMLIFFLGLVFIWFLLKIFESVLYFFFNRGLWYMGRWMIRLVFVIWSNVFWIVWVNWVILWLFLFCLGLGIMMVLVL